MPLGNVKVKTDERDYTCEPIKSYLCNALNFVVSTSVSVCRQTLAGMYAMSSAKTNIINGANNFFVTYPQSSVSLTLPICFAVKMEDVWIDVPLSILFTCVTVPVNASCSVVIVARLQPAMDEVVAEFLWSCY